MNVNLGEMKDIESVGCELGCAGVTLRTDRENWTAKDFSPSPRV
jgi:hypothetical protein